MPREYVAAEDAQHDTDFQREYSGKKLR